MADQEQLELLKKGAAGWNEWRTQHPDISLDRNEVNLMGANLSGANLDGANLTRANLREADLHGAILRRAYLRGANLIHASLQRVDFRVADLSKAVLSRSPLRWDGRPVQSMRSSGRLDVSWIHAALRDAMADQEHLELLKHGVTSWNAWRLQHPEINPVRALATNTGCFAGRMTSLKGRRGSYGGAWLF
jgi:hypothetical protein